MASDNPIVIKRTSTNDLDFKAMVKLLDIDLKIRDGDDHEFYAQFNNIDTIKYATVAYLEQEPVGCGAIKAFDSKTMEVKRMFVTPELRGNGIASAILNDLEQWTKELNHSRCILETGVNQPEAIRLYQKNKYERISNFAQYKNVKTSLCFEKYI